MPRPAISSPPAAGASTQCEAGALPVPQAPLAQTPDKESKSNKAAAQQLINKAVKKSAPTLPAQAKVTPLAPTGATAAASSSMSKRQIRKQQELAATLKQNVYALFDDKAAPAASAAFNSARKLTDLVASRFHMNLLTEDCRLERTFTRLLSVLSAATKLPPELLKGVGGAVMISLVSVAQVSAHMISFLACPRAESESEKALAEQLNGCLAEQLASPPTIVAIALCLHATTRYAPATVANFLIPLNSMVMVGTQSLLNEKQQVFPRMQLPGLVTGSGADLPSLLMVLQSGTTIIKRDWAMMYHMAEHCLNCLHCGLFHLVHKQPRHPLLPELLECALVAVSAWAQLMAPTARSIQAGGQSIINQDAGTKLAMHVAQAQWLWTTAHDSSRQTPESALMKRLCREEGLTGALVLLAKALLFDADDIKVHAALHMLSAISWRMRPGVSHSDDCFNGACVYRLLSFAHQHANQLGCSQWEHSPSVPAMALFIAVDSHKRGYNRSGADDMHEQLGRSMGQLCDHVEAHNGVLGSSLPDGQPHGCAGAGATPLPLTSWAADAVALLAAAFVHQGSRSRGVLGVNTWRLMALLQRQQVQQRRARAQAPVPLPGQSDRSAPVQPPVPHQQDVEAMAELHGLHKRFISQGLQGQDWQPLMAECVEAGCSLFELLLGQGCFAVDLILRDAAHTPPGCGGGSCNQSLRVSSVDGLGYLEALDFLLDLLGVGSDDDLLKDLRVEVILLREELVAMLHHLTGLYQQQPLPERAATSITLILKELEWRKADDSGGHGQPTDELAQEQVARA